MLKLIPILLISYILSAPISNEQADRVAQNIFVELKVYQNIEVGFVKKIFFSAALNNNLFIIIICYIICYFVTKRNRSNIH